VSVILVIDEHRVYRSGIRELIEAAIQHAHVIDAPDFSSFTNSRYFDLVLIDSGSLSYPVLDLLKEIHALYPATRFAVMSSSNTRADVLNCLSAGFHGFVHKLQSDQELLTAIKDLLSGRIYVPRWIADRDDETPELASSISTAVQALRLTRRQHEILPLIAQGMSNKEIASSLNIAEGTVKIHTAALLHALGVRNRTEAAFRASKLVGSRIRTERRFDHEGFVAGRPGEPVLQWSGHARLGTVANHWLRHDAKSFRVMNRIAFDSIPT
jgi:DNA-binding NarL/FixJ family response regulator